MAALRMCSYGCGHPGVRQFLSGQEGAGACRAALPAGGTGAGDQSGTGSAQQRQWGSMPGWPRAPVRRSCTGGSSQRNFLPLRRRWSGRVRPRSAGSMRQTYQVVVARGRRGPAAAVPARGGSAARGGAIWLRGPSPASHAAARPVALWRAASRAPLPPFKSQSRRAARRIPGRRPVEAAPVRRATGSRARFACGADARYAGDSMQHNASPLGGRRNPRNRPCSSQREGGTAMPEPVILEVFSDYI